MKVRLDIFVKGWRTQLRKERWEEGIGSIPNDFVWRLYSVEEPENPSWLVWSHRTLYELRQCFDGAKAAAHQMGFEIEDLDQWTAFVEEVESQ